MSSLSSHSAAFSSLPVLPIVANISEDQIVISPAPVVFNCTVDSYPSSTITWLRNGAEVQAAPSRVTISAVQVDNRTQESTLTLFNTTAEDTGTYTCSAVNSVGTGNMTTELQVLGEYKVYLMDGLTVCVLPGVSYVMNGIESSLYILATLLLPLRAVLTVKPAPPRSLLYHLTVV